MKDAIGTAIVLLTLAAAAASQTPAGGEFRVNTQTWSGQNTARLAMTPDGDFVVVWMSYGYDGSGFGVFGQRFAASGAPRGIEFQVNTYTTGHQEFQSVAVGSKGDFIVVWVSFQDGSSASVHGRRYDSAGSAIGGEFRVNTFTSGKQYVPRVGLASDGRFVVSWYSEFIDGSFYGIVARRFDGSGNPIGGEFVVNTYTTDNQLRGDIGVDANGSFVVVWEDVSDRDGSGSAIVGQRFGASGDRLGTEFLVNSDTTGSQISPSVSVSPSGGFVVAWRSGDGSLYGVFARRFDASGNAMGNDFLVNTYTTGRQENSQVAHDAGGNFVVTWHGNDDGSFFGSAAQRFNASGARRGGEFQVNTYTTAIQKFPSLASDSVGNFVVVWESGGQDGSNYGIFAQRFGGLGPAALTVDSLGNQVLEAGETVDVRPAWRNLNGAAQTFGGTLDNITGPAGANYTITDAAGDYGTVADGATAPCSDCYVISVSNPPTRPAVHWDAAAVESILPDTQGQQKQWLLHLGESFADVPISSGFYRFVETLLHNGITSGCNATDYCPLDGTTREQMAVLVLVAKEGAGYIPPACTTPVFGDVPPNSPFCRWIEELARRGVVTGCGGGNYCPTAEVTREEMSVFVLRALDPALAPPACAPPNLFSDVPETSPFCRWIEELARRGVVTGCGGGNYCPAAAVTREQMAVFLSVTFGLMLYGP